MSTRTDRVDDQIVELLPLGGPYTPERTTQAAASIAAIVRYLNHATGPATAGDAIEYPSELARALGSLAGAVAGMTQLTRQFASQADDFGHRDDLYADNGADPTDEIVEAVQALADCGGLLGIAHDTLTRAHQAMNRIGVR